MFGRVLEGAERAEEVCEDGKRGYPAYATRRGLEVLMGYWKTAQRAQSERQEREGGLLLKKVDVYFLTESWHEPFSDRR